jgi:hypothetical protein
MSDVQAIVAVATGVASGVSVGVTKVRLARSAASDFAAAKGWISRAQAARASIRDTKRLLGFHHSDGVIYRSDNVHPLYGQPATIHPDNRRALLAAAGEDYVLADSLGTVELQTRVGAQLDDNLVLIGSPTSEGISRLVFGYTLAPEVGDSLILDAAPVDLPYRMLLDLEHVPGTAIARRYVENRGVTIRPNWRIESDVGTFIPELDDDGWLRTDYLLITRLRNFLTPDGFARGHTVVSIAGTHGVGTRALGLLLNDNMLLREIGSVTRERDCPSFQALFRVSDISHDTRTGSHSRKIQLVAPPSLIADNPERWRTAQSVVRSPAEAWIQDKQGTA